MTKKTIYTPLLSGDDQEFTTPLLSGEGQG